MFELCWVDRYDVPDEGAWRRLMQPLASAVEYDITRLHFCATQHRQRFGLCRKADEGGPRCELQIGYVWGSFLTPQHLQMVQLRPGEAGSKLLLRYDDGVDLCLTKARLVVIGLQERTRAAARHLSSCKVKGAQCGLCRSIDLPTQDDYADFGDFEANRSLSLGAVMRVDAVPSKAIHRTASGRQPKSGLIPRTRYPRRSR